MGQRCQQAPHLHLHLESGTMRWHPRHLMGASRSRGVEAGPRSFLASWQQGLRTSEEVEVRRGSGGRTGGGLVDLGVTV